MVPCTLLPPPPASLILLLPSITCSHLVGVVCFPFLFLSRGQHTVSFPVASHHHLQTLHISHGCCGMHTMLLKIYGVPRQSIGGAMCPHSMRSLECPRWPRIAPGKRLRERKEHTAKTNPSRKCSPSFFILGTVNIQRKCQEKHAL